MSKIITPGKSDIDYQDLFPIIYDIILIGIIMT